MQLKIYRVTSNLVNVYKRAKLIKRNNDGPLPSPTVLCIVSACKRKLWLKKKKKKEKKKATTEAKKIIKLNEL